MLQCRDGQLFQKSPYLFSTAIDSRALGGASDRDHLMIMYRSSIKTSRDLGKHYCSVKHLQYVLMQSYVVKKRN